MARNIILIVDNDEANIERFKDIYVEGKYKVVVKSNSKDALAFLTQHHREHALILIDVNRPGVEGAAMLKVLFAKGITKIIPVAIISAVTDEGRIVKCYKYGAIDYIEKPFSSIILQARIANIIELYENKHELEAKINLQTKKIKEQNQELITYNDKLIEVMSTVVEFRNLESGDHIKRIKKMTRIMTETVRSLYPEQYQISDKDVEIFESASALHDVGKISISDSILLKPGRLTEDEFEVVKSHTTLGCEILHEIEDMQDRRYMEVSYNICRHHHERYDGKGYPDNLSGENIPIEAQIVAIADAYESLVGERVYRDAFDKKKAFEMIMNGECGAFSNNLLKAFEKARPEMEKVVDN